LTHFRGLDEKGFVEASLWADTIDIDEDLHFVHMRTDEHNHFIPYEELVDCGHGGSGRCIITGIARFSLSVLESAIAGDVDMDSFKMLLHLLADLHQPLHVGRAADHGGVAIKLVYPEDHSLHEVWDSFLLKDSPIGELIDSNDELIRLERIRFKKIWPHDRVMDNVDDVIAVVNEWVVGIVNNIAPEYTIPSAYKNEKQNWIAGGDVLSSTYLTSRSQIASKLVRLAGVRTALLLNRLSRFVRKVRSLREYDVPVAPEPAVAAPTNRYEALTVDEIDFEPEDLAEVESVEPVAVRLKKEPVMYEGIDLSSLGLFKTSGKLQIRPRGPRGVIGRKWVCYRFYFPRNTCEKSLAIDVAMDCFPKGFEVTPSALMAILYHIRGVGVSTKVSSVSKGLLAKGSAPPVSQITRARGMLSNLPSFFTRGIELSAENTFTSPYSGDIYIRKSATTVELTPESVQKKIDALSLQAEIARRRFPDIPDTEDQLQALDLAMLERKCNMVILASSKDEGVYFFTTATSVKNSREKPFSPMKARIYETRGMVNKGGNPAIWLVDLNLLSDFLGAHNVGTLMKCANENISGNFDMRPGIGIEMDEIQRIISDPYNINTGPKRLLNRIMIYSDNRPMDDVPVIEWDVRDDVTIKSVKK
jgi:hypothetical protein